MSQPSRPNRDRAEGRGLPFDELQFSSNHTLGTFDVARVEIRGEVIWKVRLEQRLERASAVMSTDRIIRRHHKLSDFELKRAASCWFWL